MDTDNPKFKEQQKIDEALQVLAQNALFTNKALMNKVLIHDEHWGHGANEDFLGFGILYYGFVHLLKAKVVVCLGSGGGFVPRVMYQAQFDLGLNKSRTILIDANKPEVGWGSPEYLYENSFLRKVCPNIEIWNMTTEDAHKAFIAQELKIDYLHIDADHSFKGVMADFNRYLPLMSKDYVITLHDTNTPRSGLRKALQYIRKTPGIEVIDFNNLWAGLAIVKSATEPNQKVSLKEYIYENSGFILKKISPRLYGFIKNKMQQRGLL